MNTPPVTPTGLNFTSFAGGLDGCSNDGLPWAVKKVTLPEFSGFDPHGWIQKTNLYFDMNQTADESRLQLARLSMIGVAQHWFTIITQIRPSISWPDFQLELLQRFSGITLHKPAKKVEELLRPTFNSGSGVSNRFRDQHAKGEGMDFSPNQQFNNLGQGDKKIGPNFKPTKQPNIVRTDINRSFPSSRAIAIHSSKNYSPQNRDRGPAHKYPEGKIRTLLLGDDAGDDEDKHGVSKSEVSPVISTSSLIAKLEELISKSETRSSLIANLEPSPIPPSIEHLPPMSVFSSGSLGNGVDQKILQGKGSGVATAPNPLVLVMSSDLISLMFGELEGLLAPVFAFQQPPKFAVFEQQFSMATIVCVFKMDDRRLGWKGGTLLINHGDPVPTHHSWVVHGQGRPPEDAIEEAFTWMSSQLDK